MNKQLEMAKRQRRWWFSKTMAEGLILRAEPENYDPAADEELGLVWH
jgi:hypothetical protein